MADAIDDDAQSAATDRPDPNATRAPLNPPGIDPRPEAGPGAGDGNSGGGPGGGLLDAESAMRLGDDLATKSDPDADRERLFPGANRREQDGDDPAEAQPE